LAGVAVGVRRTPQELEPGTVTFVRLPPRMLRMWAGCLVERRYSNLV